MFEMGIDLFALPLICLPINEALPRPPLNFWNSGAATVKFVIDVCLKIMRFTAINIEKNKKLNLID